MTANEIFDELLKDPILIEKYGFTEKQLKNMQLHEPSSKPIIELIKRIVLGSTENMPQSSIYKQIKTFLNIN